MAGHGLEDLMQRETLEARIISPTVRAPCYTLQYECRTRARPIQYGRIHYECRTRACPVQYRSIQYECRTRARPGQYERIQYCCTLYRYHILVHTVSRRRNPTVSIMLYVHWMGHQQMAVGYTTKSLFHCTGKSQRIVTCPKGRSGEGASPSGIDRRTSQSGRTTFLKQTERSSTLLPPF